MGYVDEYGIKRPSAEYMKAHTALVFTPARIEHAITDFNSFYDKSKKKVRVKEPERDKSSGEITLQFIIKEELSEKVKKKFKRTAPEGVDELYEQGYKGPYITWTAKPTNSKDTLRSKYWYTDIGYIYGGTYLNDLIAGKTRKTPSYSPEYIDILQNTALILRRNALQQIENGLFPSLRGNRSLS